MLGKFSIMAKYINTFFETNNNKVRYCHIFLNIWRKKTIDAYL